MSNVTQTADYLARRALSRKALVKQAAFSLGDPMTAGLIGAGVGGTALAGADYLTNGKKSHPGQNFLLGAGLGGAAGAGLSYVNSRGVTPDNPGGGAVAGTKNILGDISNDYGKSTDPTNPGYRPHTIDKVWSATPAAAIGAGATIGGGAQYLGSRLYRPQFNADAKDMAAIGTRKILATDTPHPLKSVLYGDIAKMPAADPELKNAVMEFNRNPQAATANPRLNDLLQNGYPRQMANPGEFQKSISRRAIATVKDPQKAESDLMNELRQNEQNLATTARGEAIQNVGGKIGAGVATAYPWIAPAAIGGGSFGRAYDLLGRFFNKDYQPTTPD